MDCGIDFSLNANERGSVFLFHVDKYESLPTQDTKEDSFMTPDIYNSPTEHFPPGNEVQYC